MVIETREYDSEKPFFRQMWIYPSERHFIGSCGYILSQHPMTEKGVSVVKISAEQKRIMQPGFKRVLNPDFWNHNKIYADCLYLDVPGLPLGMHEAAVAQFDKAVKDDVTKKYYVPVTIYASIDQT